MLNFGNLSSTRLTTNPKEKKTLTELKTIKIYYGKPEQISVISIQNVTVKPTFHGSLVLSNSCKNKLTVKNNRGTNTNTLSEFQGHVRVNCPKITIFYIIK